MNIPEFEYFYNYFMPGKRTVSKRVSLYFEEILKLVSSTNSIKAINNEAYYQKLKRKADKLEFILTKIIVIDPNFLSSFSMDYYHEKKDNIITILKESFYNTFKIDGLLPVLLSSKEKIELTNRYKNLDIIDLFILDFSGINYFSRYIDDIKPLKSRELTNEENKSTLKKRSYTQINDSSLKNNKKNNTNYDLKALEFVKDCNNCHTLNPRIIYKCVVCDNYFLCQKCYQTKKKFHEEHEFYEIIFPPKIISQMQSKIQNYNKCSKALDNFNILLKKIFFEKNGNLSLKKITESDLKPLQQICRDMNSDNESALIYFTEYKNSYINNISFEKINKEEKIIIADKLVIFSNKLYEYENK